jgi:hypothetical protein
MFLDYAWQKRDEQEMRDETSRSIRYAINMDIIGCAFHDYYDEYGALPPLYTIDEEGKPLHSWRVLILPFLGRHGLYSQIRLDEPWDSDYNRQFHDKMPWFYTCLSNPRMGCTYSAVAGWSLIPAEVAGSVRGLTFQDFPDGLGDTLALVEVRMAFNWMDPMADVSVEDLVQNNRVGSYHTIRGRESVRIMFLDRNIIVREPSQLRRMVPRRFAE